MTTKEAERELGVAPGTRDPQQLKAAFRARVKITHPDRPGGSQQAFKHTHDAYAILTGAQQPTQAAPPPPPPRQTKPTPPPKPATPINPQASREDWLLAAMAHLAAHAALASITVPALRISTGYGVGGNRSKRGWQLSTATADSTPQVFISPEEDKPEKILAAAAAAAAQLLGTRQERDALDGIRSIAEPEILKALGPYPHAKIKSNVRTKHSQPGQTTRLLKAVCPDCGYTIRLSAKWAQTGLPVCGPCGHEFELA